MNRLFFFLSLIFILSLISCSPFDPPPIGSETGSISGSIQLYDEGGAVQIPSAGVKISLEGTNPLIHTFSDQFGRYELKNVPFGPYVVVFEKVGYGTFKYMGEEGKPFIHSSKVVNTQIPSLGISEKSTTQIEDFNLEKVDGGYNFIITSSPPPSQSRTGYFLFLISHTNPNFSELNYDYLFTFNSRSNPSILFLSDAVVETLFSVKSNQAFIRVYGNTYLNNGYLENGRRVFPNLNPVASRVIQLERP
ncbi:carboxypeptidase-like regulatory domain-containing protein [Algoriphagus mannitolivorans]|uniref:carboxypeptidase-like regulatory domain-containing protein n=1 Tax=Algoriphagus mannitolivorans TaxID=226504 RepID=UPI00047C8AF4|nr:carboxypeptidase-like regulatory domain-containing protein [Algoriphagus mannitolivorans]